MCSVFWLFWLSCQYLPNDWLERLLRGSLTVARGSSPESSGRRVLIIFLVYYIVSLFYYMSVLSPGPTWYIFLLLWHDSLFVLKVALNTKQTNKPPLRLNFVVVNKCYNMKSYVLPVFLLSAAITGQFYCVLVLALRSSWQRKLCPSSRVCL